MPGVKTVPPHANMVSLAAMIEIRLMTEADLPLGLSLCRQAIVKGKRIGPAFALDADILTIVPDDLAVRRCGDDACDVR